MKTKTWEKVWAVWLVIVAVSFAILEGAALARPKERGTLSERTRHWIGTESRWKSWGALGFAAALIAFVIWFIPHIVFQTW